MKTLFIKYNLPKNTIVCIATLLLVVMFYSNAFAYSGYFLEKETFLKKDGKLTSQTTFDPGDEVVVRLHLDPNTNTTTQYAVEDIRPKGSIASVDSITTPSGCSLSADQKILSANYEANQDGDSSTFSDIEKGVSGYLCYSYKLIYLPLPQKNVLERLSSYVIDPANSNQKVASSNNYLLVKGSSSDAFVPSDDRLLSSSQSLFQNGTSGQESLAFAPSYIFSRGQGPNSRGGLLYSLPVQMTDSSGSRVFDRDSFYLLYNPLYSVLGNVFSGSQTVGGAIDFGSKSNSISQSNDAFTSKLNSEAALYGYSFDKNSALYWDLSNTQKNTQMKASIDKLINFPRPDIVCSLNSTDLSGGNYFLDNPDCHISSSSQKKLWPNGRVWYLKAAAGQSSINFTGTINGRGTLLVDFRSVGGTPVLNLRNLQFANGASLGIILVGGGNVNFAGDCTNFNGLIFAPGKDTPPYLGGEIIFEKDGSPIQIKGSLVANRVRFNPRDKGSSQFAVSISVNQALLNTPLPGFDSISSVIFDQ